MGWCSHSTCTPTSSLPPAIPLTAEDVRFSWMRLINIKGSGAEYLTMVDKIEVVDDLTLKVTLKYPSPEFMSAVATGLCAVLDSKVAKENGATDAADADTDRHS